MMENDGAILRAHIRPLTVARGRVVVAPEDVEQRFEGDFRGIIVDLHYFRMAGFISANILISRVLRSPSSVTNRHILHSSRLPEDRLDSPETTGTKRRFFNGHGCTIKREGEWRNRPA
jgi:hypothetical protein